MKSQFKSSDKKNPKPKVGVIFGGVSSEHSISCISASSVLAHIDREKYDVFAIGITKNGDWFLVSSNPKDWQKKGNKLPEVKAPSGMSRMKLKKKAIHIDIKIGGLDLDVVFPVLHGAYGEDGTIQGLFETLGIKYVGCGVLSSAIIQDKHFAKLVFESAGLKVAPWITLKQKDGSSNSLSSKELKQIEELSDGWKKRLFVKPARAGSSVGVNRVSDEKELNKAIKKAFEYDSKILIEKEIAAREIECAVFQTVKNQNDKNSDKNANKVTDKKISTHVSTLGEIVVEKNSFYDYDSKYVSKTAAKLRVNPPMDSELKKRLQNVAKTAFEATDCEGLARVDMFLTAKGEIFVNEINTLPGFTQISMFPTLLQNDGFEYSKIISGLIEEALSRKSVEFKPHLNGGVLR